MKRQRLLLLLLLGPPRFELRELLCCGIGFVGADPGHVLGNVLLHVLDGGNLLLHCLWNVRPGLKLNGPLFHGAKEVLQGLQLGLELALGGPSLVHPLLVLCAELQDLLALLLRGDLDNVVPLQLVPAAVDVGLQLVSQTRHGRNLLLVLLELLETLLQLLDLLLGQSLGLVVHPLELELLLMLLLLLLQHHLWLVCGVGVVGALGCFCLVVLAFLLVCFLVFLALCLALCLALRGVLAGVGLGDVWLRLLLGHVHPVQLLDGGHGLLHF
mmetsp:Transcript_107218/g.255974  ORF Transcript_107218/g.255974 Transcript_107218/m.255974 type:complete len:270 (-) Transcript_107218:1668-2477(-)